MVSISRRLIACAAVVATLAAVAPPARSADYPNRPIRLVVPYPPGGGTDVAARRLAEEMGKGLGQRLVVENVGGAGGLLGMQQVARAEPNGYTLVLALTAQFAVNPSLFPNLPYDPVNDYAPIALLAAAPYVLVVHPDLPVRSVTDLVALARRQTDKLSYASAGNGSGAHLSSELLKRMAGIDMVHVPYKGAGAAYTDLLAGRIPLMFSTYATVSGHLEAGRLRAIAVSTEQRAPGLKDVPAIAETLPGYRSDVWYVLAAPAGTPNDIVARLNTEALAALKSPVIAKQLADDLIQVVGSRPDEVKPFIVTEIAKWGEVVKRSGAHIQ
jgi:tripartite-type tricarboxylate transporter receptor subunit TctC